MVRLAGLIAVAVLPLYGVVTSGAPWWLKAPVCVAILPLSWAVFLWARHLVAHENLWRSCAVCYKERRDAPVRRWISERRPAN